MYHIKQDKRSQASARLIGEAMLVCLERKPFEHITIVDLQRESSVGRSTFYRLFDRTEDVLEWMYERQIQEIRREYQEMSPERRPHFLKYCLDYFYGNSTLVEHLVKAQKLGILLRIHQRNMPWVMEQLSLTDEGTEENFEYYSATLTALLVALLMVWTQRGKRETPDEMNQILREQMRLAVKIMDNVKN